VIDEIDAKIIELLQIDGRMAYTKIGQKIGLSEASVRRRVKKLIEEEKLQIIGIVEPNDLGWNEAGMVGISVQPDMLNSVADAIAKLDEVSYLFQAAGEFDLFAEVYCKDKNHFVFFLNERLQKIPGVERIRSFIILKIHKLSYSWGQSP